jgi:hypothetical protein
MFLGLKEKFKNLWELLFPLNSRPWWKTLYWEEDWWTYWIYNWNVYFQYKYSGKPPKIIEWADAKTFKTLDTRDVTYAVDKNYVYVFDKIVEWADPKTFEVIDCYKWYWKDENHIYLYENVLENSDPETFQAYWDYLFDKNNVYLEDGKLIKWADPKTYESLSIMVNWGRQIAYSKDKNHIYYIWEEIKWADVKTFRVIDYYKEFDAEDKNHKYKDWEIYKNMESWDLKHPPKQIEYKTYEWWNYFSLDFVILVWFPILLWIITIIVSIFFKIWEISNNF